MDEKTLTALQGSIAKWQAIVDGGGIDDGPENCPLCQEFHQVYDDDPDWAMDGCAGCPVAAHVQDSGCMGTPYEDWADYTYERRVTVSAGVTVRKVVDDTSRELAKAELDFLRSLVPLPTSSAAADAGQTKGKP